MKIKYKNKNLNINVKNCNLFQKFRGLMFRKKEDSPILLFDFNKKTRTPLHSLFVFFDFLVIWLDNKNNILEVKKVNPFKFYINTKKEFNKVIEIPITKKYDLITKYLVDN